MTKYFYSFFFTQEQVLQSKRKQRSCFINILPAELLPSNWQYSPSREFYNETMISLMPVEISVTVRSDTRKLVWTKYTPGRKEGK